jgi:hypothetical protein
VNYSVHMRSWLARFFLAFMSTMVLSGVFFLHKHTTRDGQIVVHVHPYDVFGDDEEFPDHHSSDSEIYHFNVQYSGQYLSVALDVLEIPHSIALGECPFWVGQIGFAQDPLSYSYLRGPPVKMV